MTTTKEFGKIYRGLTISPAFEDQDYWYYPMTNGSVWVECKHESFGWSATRDSVVRTDALNKWFSLAD